MSVMDVIKEFVGRDVSTIVHLYLDTCNFCLTVSTKLIPFHSFNVKEKYCITWNERYEMITRCVCETCASHFDHLEGLFNHMHEDYKFMEESQQLKYMSNYMKNVEAGEQALSKREHPKSLIKFCYGYTGRLEYALNTRLEAKRKRKKEQEMKLCRERNKWRTDEVTRFRTSSSRDLTLES